MEQISPPKVSILVVEDHPDVLHGTVRLLEKAGYLVDEATNGEDALCSVQHRQPDMVLLDRDLPGLDGIEVCRRLKADHALQAIFVIMISGSYTQSEDQVMGLEAGADGYIARPIANRELVARIEAYVRILALHRSLRAHVHELENQIVERERTERALAESQSLKRAIIDSTTDLIWSVDHREFGLQTFNRSLQEFFRTNRGIGLEVGLRPEDLFQRHETDFVESWKGFYQRALDSGPFTTEYAAYGGATTLLLTFCPLRRDDEIFGVSVFGQDITERKRAELELQRSERALKTISACDQALVRAATEAELLEQICRVIIDIGGYQMAWVGWAENDEAKTVRVAAMAGHEAGYLAEAKVSWSETNERGRGPAGMAIRTGQTIVCEDVQTDPLFAPWREAVRQLGYASAVCLPLRHAEKTFGMLMIYAAETKAFHRADVALLSTMSADLAYGLQALRMRLQHQQAVAALLESEEKHWTILTNAPVGIFQSVVDRLIFVNPAMATMFGYASPAEMLASEPDPTTFFVHPEQRSLLIREARSSGTYVNHELDERRKDGSIFTTSTHLRVVCDAAGSIKFVEGFVQDITARKRMEESHARLATAIEQSAETVVITDMQGAILYANPAFEKTSGYTCAEALGRTPRVLKSGKHDADFYRHMWDTLQRGEVWTGHFINQRKDGTLYEEDASISPLRDAHGAIINYVAVKRDVTHEVQLEAQVRQSQKLEAIGTLAGGIAHDFNNMLGAMFGYAHLLQQDTEGNPLAQESVEEILKAANRAKELVQQILTFSRQRESSRQVIRLDGIIKEAMKFLRASLPANLKIAMQLAPATPAVLADATQIYQVTMNLATNAVHAMEGRNGQLTVTLEPFQPDAAFVHTHPQSRPIPYARLTLADTGHGMDAKTLARIYEPFFTTKPVGQGTGLGLAVVHGIMESHDGVITVESQVGQGTTFRLYFPAQDQTDTIAAAPDAVPHGQGQRILVLDDEPALTAVLQKMLRRLDYQVTTSNHASEAIRRFRENPAGFDLVITDLTMPEMNGLEVTSQLRALCPDLPVILVSGYSVAVDAERLRAAGISERLDKPVSPGAIAEAVARVFVKASL